MPEKLKKNINYSKEKRDNTRSTWINLNYTRSEANRFGNAYFIVSDRWAKIMSF
jgi:hypothetical protein